MSPFWYSILKIPAGNHYIQDIYDIRSVGSVKLNQLYVIMSVRDAYVYVYVNNLHAILRVKLTANQIEFSPS